MSAEKNYLRGYLRVSPAALAVWRAIEAKHLATVELPRPLLDLGCGFGEFTGVFFDEPVVDSLVRALESADARAWDREAIREHAAAFSRDRFQQQLMNTLRQVAA